MYKKWFVLFGTLVLVVGAFLGFLRAHTGPVSTAIDLFPPFMVGAGGGNLDSGVVAIRPSGVSLKLSKRALGVVQLNTTPSSGTLDVWFQSSPDYGTSWQDFAHVQVTGNGNGGTYYVPLALHSETYPTTVPSASDGTLAVNTITQYVIGNKIRAKCRAQIPQTASGVFAIHVYVIPD